MPGRKNSHADRRKESPWRDEEGQSYARATKMLGNGRLLAVCEAGVERVCKIRGSMRRSEWISPGDIILISLREFQSDKADVLCRYTLTEVARMRRAGELDALHEAAAAAAAETEHDKDAENNNEDLVDFIDDI